MKHLISLFLAFAMLLCLISCSKAGESGIINGATMLAEPAYQRESRDSNPVKEDSISAINQFSYNTAAQVFKGIETNGCYSPLSLYFALALAANGADGTTSDELLMLLGSENKTNLTRQCGNLYRILYNDSEISKLKIADSLWLDNEINGQKVTFKDSFLKNAADDLYASVYTVNFSDESAGKAMSKWISQKTNGNIIPKFNVNPDQIMCILNTVYFYDEWKDRFDVEDTKTDTFYLDNSKKVACKFMNMTNFSNIFFKGNGYIRSSLQLKGNGSMVFILPDKDIDVSSLLLSKEKIEEIFSQGTMINGEIVWSVPKFEHNSSFTLKDTLKSLGIAAAFSQQDADFSSITDNKSYISDVKQETHISINENGVEAGAFTQIDYSGAALPKGKAEMVLNRPFIYGITAPNGTLLFVGVCRNPTSR